MQTIKETKGLILFSREYQEKDKLVKVFTESYGKVMFVAKNVHSRNSPLASGILSFTEAVFIGAIRQNGLSYLNGVKESTAFREIQTDIFISAYATYILNLMDVAVEDHDHDPALYGFTKQALNMLNQKKDPEIITAIFEIQVLNRFGVAPEWRHCAICGRKAGTVFDYSSKYSGILCQEHFPADPNRYHANSKALSFVRMFAQISYHQINSIQISDDIKKEIRKVIDALYDEYVGIQLKSKKFIKEMANWENILKNNE